MYYGNLATVGGGGANGANNTKQDRTQTANVWFTGTGGTCEIGLAESQKF